MIGYTTVGSNDLEKAVGFYDEVLAVLGAQRIMNSERMKLYGNDPASPMFGVCTPFDEQAASVGNGVMIALAAQSKAQVDEIHAKALAAGGSDEGSPGPRGDNFYGGYFRDLDGNKLVAFSTS